LVKQVLGPRCKETVFSYPGIMNMMLKMMLLIVRQFRWVIHSSNFFSGFNQTIKIKISNLLDRMKNVRMWLKDIPLKKSAQNGPDKFARQRRKRLRSIPQKQIVKKFLENFAGPLVAYCLLDLKSALTRRRQ